MSGATGYLGQCLLSRLPAGMEVAVLARRHLPGSIPFDLGAPFKFDYSRISKGDVFVHGAAISSPDACESDYDKAYRINVTGSRHVIERTLDRGVKVIFLSTDAVYGETDAEVDEKGPCRPVGSYARMKHQIEREFLGAPGFMTVRMSYVLSRDDKYTAYMTKCAAEGRPATVYQAIRRNAIYAGDVADLIGSLCAGNEWPSGGIVNAAGPENISRLELACLYATRVDSRLNYAAVEPPPGFFTARPRTIAMRSIHLALLLGRRPRSPAEAYSIDFNVRD
jgi:dTDP-4-dehydrorhamnose reductase